MPTTKPKKSRKKASEIWSADTPVAEQAAGSVATEPSADKFQRSKTSAGKNKSALILGLLQRKAGASLAELEKASGWQAHSVRGFISGTLKKKLGLNISSTVSDKGTRRYQVSGGRPG